MTRAESVYPLENPLTDYATIELPNGILNLRVLGDKTNDIGG